MTSLPLSPQVPGGQPLVQAVEEVCGLRQLGQIPDGGPERVPWTCGQLRPVHRCVCVCVCVCTPDLWTTPACSQVCVCVCVCTLDLWTTPACSQVCVCVCVCTPDLWTTPACSQVCVCVCERERERERECRRVNKQHSEQTHKI